MQLPSVHSFIHFSNSNWAMPASLYSLSFPIHYSLTIYHSMLRSIAYHNKIIKITSQEKTSCLENGRKWNYIAHKMKVNAYDSKILPDRAVVVTSIQFLVCNKHRCRYVLPKTVRRAYCYLFCYCFTAAEIQPVTILLQVNMFNFVVTFENISRVIYDNDRINQILWSL
jgi:hypothetical protein